MTFIIFYFKIYFLFNFQSSFNVTAFLTILFVNLVVDGGEIEKLINSMIPYKLKVLATVGPLCTEMVLERKTDHIYEIIF